MRQSDHEPRPQPPRSADVRLWQWIVAAALLSALWSVVLFSLTQVFAMGSWFAGALTIVVTPVVVGMVVRVFVRTATPLRATAAGVLAGFVVWIVSFVVRGRPGAWWTEPAGEATGIWVHINAGVAPLSVEGALEDALLFVVLLVAAVTVWLFMREWVSGAGLVVAMMLLVPVAVTGFRIPLTPLLMSGVLIALIVWVGSQRPNPAGLLSAGLVLVVVGSVLQLVPQGRDRVWNYAVLFAPVSATVPDVTVALADDLRRGSDTVAFTATGLQPGQYRFTLATLMDFEDGTWLPQLELNDAGHSVEVVRSPWGLEPVVDANGLSLPLNATIIIKGLRSAWLPVSKDPFRIQGTDEFDPSEWIWVEGSPTARSETRVTLDGDKYYLEASPTLPPDFSSALSDELSERQLSGEGPTLYASGENIPAEIAPYLALPEGMPDEMRETAQTVAGGSDNAMGAALLLQEYFTSGQFSYDESAPYEPGADPADPYTVMTAFLEQRSGFCVHYASTFAVLARELGIPTRLSVGYAAGVPQNESSVTVRGADLHAWPEIYVDGPGWISFEPTPGGAGVSTDRSNEEAEVREIEQNEVERESPRATPDAPSEKPEAESRNLKVQGDASGVWGTGLIIGLFVVGILLLLVVPAAVRVARAASRANHITQGVQPAQQAWAEIIDTATDLGLLTHATPLRARTPDALIEHLADHGSLGNETAEAMRLLAGWMEAERYSGQTICQGTQNAGSGSPRLTEDIADCLSAVRRGLADRATRRQRITARVMPRSVLNRKSM